VDRQAGEQEPLDGRLTRRRLALEDVHDIEWNRGRRGLRRVRRSRQCNAHCGEAELRDPVATRRMALALRPLDVGPRRERHLATHGELRRRSDLAKSSLVFVGESPVLKRANDECPPCLDEA
jgi:hypothetical protein